MDRSRAQHPSGVAWALSRIGAEVSERFARRVAEIGLSPSDAALLRTVGRGPASQRELADRLGLVPSRLVVLIDSLEARGLLERAVDPGDRRRRVIELTGDGRSRLAELGRVAREHDRDVLGSLGPESVTQLRQLLGEVEESLGLSHGGHPRMR